MYSHCARLRSPSPDIVGEYCGKADDAPTELVATCDGYADQKSMISFSQKPLRRKITERNKLEFDLRVDFVLCVFSCLRTVSVLSSHNAIQRHRVARFEAFVFATKCYDPTYPARDSGERTFS